MKDFQDKTAFITGGGAGIGLGMARAFAEAGMRLALVDIDAGKLEEARQLFLDAGVQVRCYALDITQRDSLKAAAKDAAAELGGLHLVCANAGVTGYLGPLDKASDTDWEWIIDVNLKGSVNTIQATLPYLLEQPQSHIVLTSSISGLRVHDPSRGQGMYNTTKYAIVGLGEALALDLAPKGVGVSILCPGVVNTEISHSGRHRQPQYGGAFETAGEDFVLAKAASHGTDPLVFGRWVRKAVEREQLFVITHPGDRDQVAARHQRIMAAFDQSAELTGED